MKIMINQPIGIIDSGLGGLTVMKEIIQQLPNEDIVYIGDTKHCPYGDKNIEQIKIFVSDIVDKLIDRNIKLLVIACNTATVLMLDELQQRLNIPVIGMLDRISQQIFDLTETKEIGVIATDATVSTHKYQQKIMSYTPEVTVIEKGCPTFVPLIEQGLTKSLALKKAVNNELKIFKDTKIDTLVLGCTHFPMIKEKIQQYLPNIKIIDPAKYVAMDVVEILEKLDFKNDQLDKGNYQVLVTKYSSEFERLAQNWLNESFKFNEV